MSTGPYTPLAAQDPDSPWSARNSYLRQQQSLQQTIESMRYGAAQRQLAEQQRQAQIEAERQRQFALQQQANQYGYDAALSDQRAGQQSAQIDQEGNIHYGLAQQAAQIQGQRDYQQAGYADYAQRQQFGQQQQLQTQQQDYGAQMAQYEAQQAAARQQSQQDFQGQQYNQDLTYKMGRDQVDDQFRMKSQEEVKQDKRRAFMEYMVQRDEAVTKEFQNGESMLDPAQQKAVTGLRAAMAKEMTNPDHTPEQREEAKWDFLQKIDGIYQSRHPMPPEMRQKKLEETVKSSLGPKYDAFKHLPWQPDGKGGLRLPEGFSVKDDPQYMATQNAHELEKIREQAKAKEGGVDTKHAEFLLKQQAHEQDLKHKQEQHEFDMEQRAATAWDNAEDRRLKNRQTFIEKGRDNPFYQMTTHSDGDVDPKTGDVQDTTSPDHAKIEDAATKAYGPDQARPYQSKRQQSQQQGQQQAAPGHKYHNRDYNVGSQDDRGELQNVDGVISPVGKPPAGAQQQQPARGQKHTDGQKEYQFDGTKWVRVK